MKTKTDLQKKIRQARKTKVALAKMLAKNPDVQRYTIDILKGLDIVILAVNIDGKARNLIEKINDITISYSYFYVADCDRNTGRDKYREFCKNHSFTF